MNRVSTTRHAAPALLLGIALPLLGGCGGPGQAVSRVSEAESVGPSACAAIEPQEKRLMVAPNNLRSTKGTLYCALYGNAVGFPSDPLKALRKDQRTLSQAHGCCVFEDVSPGWYAVSLLHDEDGSRDMTTNMFGAPTEGYGTSNDAPPRGMSPPAFEQARFEFASGHEPLIIPIRY